MTELIGKMSKAKIVSNNIELLFVSDRIEIIVIVIEAKKLEAIMILIHTVTCLDVCLAGRKDVCIASDLHTLTATWQYMNTIHEDIVVFTIMFNTEYGW